jgi:hypothetical protein
MASKLYDSFMADLTKGAINIPADTYGVILTTSAYTENQATHTKRSDVTNEVSGAGYTAGGKTVVPTITLDTATHKQTITFPQVDWPNSTITARKAVYFKRRGGAASADELVAVNDFGADFAATNGTLSVQASSVPLTNNT